MPDPGEGPEEILERRGAAITTRLRAAAMLRVGTTIERQEWGQCRFFPGQVVVDSRKGALDMAAAWNRRDTIWTDGSRLDDGSVEQRACGEPDHRRGGRATAFILATTRRCSIWRYMPLHRLSR